MLCTVFGQFISHTCFDGPPYILFFSLFSKFSVMLISEPCCVDIVYPQYTQYKKVIFLLFQEWAVISGKIADYPNDKAKWKTNFRCALNSLPQFKMICDNSKDSENPHKIYRIIRPESKTPNAERVIKCLSYLPWHIRSWVTSVFFRRPSADWGHSHWSPVHLHEQSGWRNGSKFPKD